MAELGTLAKKKKKKNTKAIVVINNQVPFASMIQTKNEIGQSTWEDILLHVCMLKYSNVE